MDAANIVLAVGNLADPIIIEDVYWVPHPNAVKVNVGTFWRSADHCLSYALVINIKKTQHKSLISVICHNQTRLPPIFLKFSLKCKFRQRHPITLPINLYPRHIKISNFSKDRLTSKKRKLQHCLSWVLQKTPFKEHRAAMQSFKACLFAARRVGEIEALHGRLVLFEGSFLKNPIEAVLQFPLLAGEPIFAEIANLDMSWIQVDRKSNRVALAKLAFQGKLEEDGWQSRLVVAYE